MHYFGGKAKLSKEIVEVLNSYRKPDQVFIEPFCGALNITAKMAGTRIANDINQYIIELYKAMQTGWQPPEIVTELDYKDAKTTTDFKLKGFIGIGCSFSGKWFGGYARCNRGRNYAKDAKNSLNRKFKTLKDVTFTSLDYRDIICENALIYCDPPYAGTTQYKTKFDTVIFWEWCREMTKKGNTVIISEYNAPADFDCIWEKNTTTEIRTKTGREPRIERLFKFSDINCKSTDS